MLTPALRRAQRDASVNARVQAIDLQALEHPLQMLRM